MPKKEVAVRAPLTRDDRVGIYKLIGEGYIPSEVVRIINKERIGKSGISLLVLERVLALPEAHKFVAKFRMEFLKDIKDVPISEKKIRLDDLEKIRQRLTYIIGTLEVDNPANVNKILSVSKRLMEILQTARDEMEHKPNLSIGIDIGGQGDLSGLTDEQLNARRGELISRASRAIKPRASAFDDHTEGDEAAGPGEPSQVLLAPPEELRRDTVPDSDLDISDVRQPDGDDPGMSPS